MKKVISLLLILSILIITGVQAFAFGNNNMPANNNTILSLSSSSVSVGEEFYLIINLDKINYTNFRVDITNSQRLMAGNLSTSDVSNLSTNNVATSFTVNKESIGLSRLGVVFTAPSQESTINFEVIITSLDDSIDTLNSQLEAINQDISDLNSTIENLNNSKNSLVETDADYESKLSAINTQLGAANELLEEKNSSKTELENKINNYSGSKVKENISVMVTSSNSKDMMDKEKLNMEDIEKSDIFKKKMQKNEDMESSMKNMQSKMSSLELNLQDAKNTISSMTKSTTYQGSNNNYLKSLEVSGLEFDSSFRKTTSDYFLTVDKNTNSVKVSAVAEDSTAIVTVYGNTNLKEGRNKVIINVTAEDGSVRTYRIFITK